MSYISDFKSAPFSLFGVNGGNTYTDPSTNNLCGCVFETEDYREVVLVQNGASALVSGVLVQSPASIGANHTDLATVTSPAIGTTTVTVTLGATLVTANQYQSGYAIVSSGTGIGQILRIASHPAAAASANVILTLEDPFSVALVAGTSTISLVLPQYGSANGTNSATSGVIINPTTATGKVLGVTLYPIPASTATVPTFGYIVCSGAVACLNDSATAIGLDLMPSSAVAGAVVTYVAATRNRIGTSVVAGQNTKAELIEVQLR